MKAVNKTLTGKSQGIVVVGTQWGDEGKGKIVDWLADEVDAVVRFQGGHNAGHTLVIGGKKTALQLIPSGVMRPNTPCFIGNGVVVDPLHLVQEIAKLQAAGVEVAGRLFISPNCPLILPLHQRVDKLREVMRSHSGVGIIGTTGKGIGPTYEDKVGRRAVKVSDLLDTNVLEQKINELFAYYGSFLEQNRTHSDLLGELSAHSVLSQLIDVRDQILPMIKDCGQEIWNMHKSGATILFEGAQGTLLDIDHGTYPFVTSSNCASAQASLGTGVGPGVLTRIYGITKAYCTRVGSGPFPTELDITVEGSVGAHLSHVGQERGTVTGRTRRCGWLDMPALRRSAMINGLTEQCITKLDVLDGLKEIFICTHYELSDGTSVDVMPASAQQLEGARPVFKTFKGWSQSTFGLSQWNELPKEAQEYVLVIEELSGVPISSVSTGPDRVQTISRDSQ